MRQHRAPAVARNLIGALLAALLALPGCAKSIDDWRADLAGDDVFARRLAVAGLTASGQPEVVDDLCNAVRDRDPEVARAACEGLARYAPAVVPRLLDVLADTAASGQRERAVAAGLLVKLGEPAVAPMLTALRDATQPQRAAVALTLGRMGAEGVDALAGLLADPDPMLAALAARGLSMSGPAGRAAWPALEQARQRPEPAVSAAAAETLRVLRAD